MLKFLFKSNLPALLLLLFACQTGTPMEGRVTYVFDGDTIRVGSEKVRLLGIDTPEVAWPEKGKKGQCFGPEAKDYLNGLLKGQKVRLVGDSLADKRDRYGRLLAWVYLDDRLINFEIVESGYGFAFRKFPNSKREAIIQAEQIAKKTQKGLWQACRVNCRKGYCEVE